MPDFPEAAVRAAAEAMQEEEDNRTYPTALTLPRIALEAAAPIHAAQERADERRKTIADLIDRMDEISGAGLKDRGVRMWVTSYGEIETWLDGLLHEAGASDQGGDDGGPH